MFLERLYCNHANNINRLRSRNSFMPFLVVEIFLDQTLDVGVIEYEIQNSV